MSRRELTGVCVFFPIRFARVSLYTLPTSCSRLVWFDYCVVKPLLVTVSLPVASKFWILYSEFVQLPAVDSSTPCMRKRGLCEDSLVVEYLAVAFSVFDFVGHHKVRMSEILTGQKSEWWIALYAFGTYMSSYETVVWCRPQGSCCFYTHLDGTPHLQYQNFQFRHKTRVTMWSRSFCCYSSPVSSKVHSAWRWLQQLTCALCPSE